MCLLIVLLKLFLPFPLHFASQGLEIGAFLSDKYQDFFYEISFFSFSGVFFSFSFVCFTLIYLFIYIIILFYFCYDFI